MTEQEEKIDSLEQKKTDQENELIALRQQLKSIEQAKDQSKVHIEGPAKVINSKTDSSMAEITSVTKDVSNSNV